MKYLLILSLLLLTGCAGAVEKVNLVNQQRATKIMTYYGYSSDQFLPSTALDKLQCGTHTHLAKVEINGRPAHVCDRRKLRAAFVKFE